MSKQAKNIRKLRSKNYSVIIESVVPTRFYWHGADFDGIEFGPFDELTKHERQLCDLPLYAISTGIISRHIIDHLKKQHSDWYDVLVSELDAEELGVPPAFLEAFKDNR